MKIKKYCECKRFVFANNWNINETYLNYGRLYRNSKVTKSWSSSRHMSKVDNTNPHFIKGNNTGQVLSNLHRDNPSGLIFVILY